MPQSRASFLLDPVTVPREERLEHYRSMAARYSRMAEREGRSFVREGLLDLARQCAAVADCLDRTVTP
jgi:hypothetical protein